MSAYLAERQSGMHIVDVTNPDNAIELSLFTTNGRVLDLELVDTLVYLADWQGGLIIVNVSNPVDPGSNRFFTA